MARMYSACPSTNAINSGNKKRRAFVAPLFIAGYGERYACLNDRPIIGDWRFPMKYRIAPHKSEEGYSVSVPGLPGCWSQGTTEQDAVENIRDAIREYLSVVEEQLHGEEIREIEVAG